MAGQAQLTVNDIILQAFHLIGEVSPNEPISADQQSTGLFLLNDILASASASGVYIPFVKEFDFVMSPGQGTYRVSDILGQDQDFVVNRIVSLEYVTILNGSTSYPIRIIPRAELYNNYYQPALQTRPGYIILNRQPEYDELVFYPLPEFAYPAQIRAKFIFDSFELNDPISNVPNYYYRFLRYALARELTSYYPSSNWTDKAEFTYQDLLKAVTSSNDFDMTIVPDLVLMHPYNRYLRNSLGFLQ